MEDKKRKHEKHIAHQERVMKFNRDKKIKLLNLILWKIEIDKYNFKDTRTEFEIKNGLCPIQWRLENNTSKICYLDKTTDLKMIDRFMSDLEFFLETFLKENKENLNSKEVKNKVKSHNLRIQELKLKKYLIGLGIKQYLSN